MPITPEMFSGTPLASVQELNEHPDDPFVLFASPDSAAVQTEGLDGPTWLPEMRTQRLTPGVLGVETLDKGAHPFEAVRGAMSEMEGRGLTVIPPKLDIPAEVTGGQPLSTYIVDHDCYHRLSGARGKCYRAFWERPVTRRNANEPPTWVTDHAVKNRFALWLVQTGVIEAPDEVIRADVTREAQTWADRQTVIEDPNKREDQVKQKTAVVDVHKTATVPALLADPAPKKPRRGRTGA